MVDTVILGTIGIDDIKTPFGEIKNTLGGSATYASVASSFFAKTGIISIVGEDFPEEHLNFFRSKGIDFSGLETRGKTFRWQGFYEYDMNEAKTLKTELNSLLLFDPKIPKEYKDAEFVLLGNADPGLQIKTLEQFTSPKFVMLDTMNFWIESRKEKLLDAMSRVNAVLINDSEARMLFQTPNLVKSANSILSLGAEFAIIKKGEHGALMFTKTHHFSAPAYPLENIIDPTGAGDSFAGSMVGYLSKTQDTSERNIRRAMVYGSSIASINAEGLGLEKLKTLNLIDVVKRYKYFKKIRMF
ncbi:MAG TPA: PfkB family carbohydrate kinase [Candidatus Nanoarchaeia archaeon]|nr:PfkB family carbohydrate kinase [Candidatus Nanoarchaeia archaeon]